jgi:hypothetical protein
MIAKKIGVALALLLAATSAGFARPLQHQPILNYAPGYYDYAPGYDSGRAYNGGGPDLSIHSQR